ncbi:MAG: hypothetical protein HC828_12705, partial [Blastochloris sp.]|nr:hypothetical protein [Blastochloris sp.]
MHILIVDRRPPSDLLQGNALIGRPLFSRLRRHHLTLICPAPAEECDRYYADLAPLFDVVRLVPSIRFPTALKGMVEPSLASSGLRAVERGAAPAFGIAVKDALAVRHFDVIHTRQLPMAGYTARLRHPAALLELV